MASQTREQRSETTASETSGTTTSTAGASNAWIQALIAAEPTSEEVVALFGELGMTELLPAVPAIPPGTPPDVGPILATLPEEAPAPEAAADVAADLTTEDGIGSDAAADQITQLANDYNQIEVWEPGVAGDQPSAVTIRTPYVLATVAEANAAASIKALTVAEGRPGAGSRVSAAATNNPFVGKGTPAQIQIAAQAVVDGGLSTTAGLQAYVNAGRTRDSGDVNGKFGVDCSGFTGIAMNELEGEGRQNNNSNNAVSYRHDGGRGFTPISPDDAAAGDVISYETTNHVVVVYATADVQLQRVGAPAGGATRRAVQLSVAEATGSQNAENSQYVRTDRKFWYFPEADQVLGRANSSGPEWVLGGIAGDALPVWESALAAATYTGNPEWTAGYVLNCASDPAGTNLRTRSASGAFTVTSSLVPNGAAVDLKEVSGDMVRVRYGGQDAINGLETWAPVRYVARDGAGWSLPERGQPAGLRAGTYSVVRNPELDAPAAEPAPAPE